MVRGNRARVRVDSLPRVSAAPSWQVLQPGNGLFQRWMPCHVVQGYTQIGSRSRIRPGTCCWQTDRQAVNSQTEQWMGQTGRRVVLCCCDQVHVCSHRRAIFVIVVPPKHCHQKNKQNCEKCLRLKLTERITGSRATACEFHLFRSTIRLESEKGHCASACMPCTFSESVLPCMRGQLCAFLL